MNFMNDLLQPHAAAALPNFPIEVALAFSSRYSGPVYWKKASLKQTNLHIAKVPFYLLCVCNSSYLKLYLTGRQLWLIWIHGMLHFVLKLSFIWNAILAFSQNFFWTLQRSANFPLFMVLGLGVRVRSRAIIWFWKKYA